MMNVDILSVEIQQQMIAHGFIVNQYANHKPLADALANAIVEHIKKYAQVTQSGGVQ